MPSGRRSPRWLAAGDWNAFFGLALDNTTQLVILSSLLIEVTSFLASVGRSPGDLAGEGKAAFQHLLVLGNGFIVTAVLWGWALASIIDGRLGRAAAVFAACAAATLLGLIHSPLASGALFWPWSAGGNGALALAAAYGVGAGLLLALAHAQSRTRWGR